jgi:hypothetical protein
VPPIETSHRRQAAVLWKAAGPDQYGEQTVLPPRQIMVRWVDTVSEAGGAQGGSSGDDVTITVAEPVPVGSIMWRGTLANWDPGVARDLVKVTSYGETPDVKGRFTAREVRARRYGQSLPAIVAD